jgi:hypothetical protein
MSASPLGSAFRQRLEKAVDFWDFIVSPRRLKSGLDFPRRFG